MNNKLLLLKDKRVEQILSGLETRLQNCVAQIDTIQSGSAEARQSSLRKSNEANELIKANYHQKHADDLTAADECSDQTWLKFDQKFATSVQTEAAVKKKLSREFVGQKKASKQRCEQDIDAAQKRMKLNVARARSLLSKQIDALGKQNVEADRIEKTLQQLEQQYRIAILSDTASPEQTDSLPPKSFEQARCDAGEKLKLAEQTYRGLYSHPAMIFSRSWMPWAVGMAIGMAAAALHWWLSDVPDAFLISFAIAGGCTVVIGVLLMLVLRPLVKQNIRRQAPKIRNDCHTTKAELNATRLTLVADYQAYNAAESDRLQQTTEQLHNTLNETLLKLKSELNSQLQTNAEQHLQLRSKATQRFDQAMAQIEHEDAQQSSTRKHTFANQLQSAEDQRLANLKSIIDEENAITAWTRFRIRSAIEHNIERLENVDQQLQLLNPPWPQHSDQISFVATPENQLGYIRLGTAEIKIGSQHKSTLQQSQTNVLQASLPIVFKLVEHGTLVVKCPRKHQAIAFQLVRSLLLRAFYCLPPGSVQATIIDPDGLGREYSNLMQLADTDPALVNHRVWTQASHIAEQLATLSHHTEDIIQQYLRDRYTDIRQYNAEAGSMSEPFRLVLWSQFPSGLDESTWRYLSSLISSGGRCGVSTILMLDTDIPLPPFVSPRQFANHGLTINIESSNDDSVPPIVNVQSKPLDQFPIVLDELPPPKMQQEILGKVAEASLKANRVEVPFESIVPSDMPLFQSSSASGLAIPMGQSGVGRRAMLRLGHGTAQHVLIAGKTGSGKSSFLHTLVTSAVLHYAPDQLRVVLLDFKKGVEFQVYSQAELPHADIIGIESQREFGLSTFEYLDRIMQRRGEAFRSAGVQDIPSWRAAKPNEPMPRILIVVDEFQEIFTEDDKLAQQSAMFLDRIVRQGRSFGLHVVLASQTLGGTYSLPRTTLSQMAVRVALQCEGSDAMMILSEDNLAAERLRYAGQAIYNDQSGRVEGNQAFQVAYLSKLNQRQLIEPLVEVVTDATITNAFQRSPLHGDTEHCIVFDGHRKASWDQAVIAATLERFQQASPGAAAILLGESVSIEPVVGIHLQPQAGQNLLVVGTDDENLTSVLHSTIESFDRFGQDAKAITLVNASRIEDEFCQRLIVQLRSRASDQLHIVAADAIDATILQLHDVMQERIAKAEARNDSDEASNEGSIQPQLLVITHLARLRSLQKGEEFSFDDAGGEKIDKLFQAILRDGPAVRIHTIVGCDNANTLNRWLPRSSMHDFEYRALMQMSVNDSNQLIDSVAANRLDRNVMLLYDQASGHTRKFRPFE